MTLARPGRAGLTILKHSLNSTCRTNKYSSYAPNEILETDVVIIGGGPAGLALASALGSHAAVENGCRVTLIEGGDLNKIKTWHPAADTFSNRVVSLTNASQAFLRDTGAWHYVDEGRTCGLEQLQVWDGVSDARIEFSAAEIAQQNSLPEMSRLIENFNLQKALIRHLDDITHVEVLDKTRVVSISCDANERGGWPLIHLDNNQTIRARLLVGADGFNSPVRKFAGIPSFGWSYDTQAIVATLNHRARGAYEHPNTTGYQRFLPTGPIAFLPLSSTVSSLVWSTKPEIATALLACEGDVLSSMINAAFRLPHVSIKHLYRLILDRHSSGNPITFEEIREEIRWREKSHGIHEHSAYISSLVEADQVGIPPEDSEAVPPLVASIQAKTAASFPLRFNHAETYLGEGIGSRTVLVGDAAHSVHPLAGQGLNLGLGDVECLARVIKINLLLGGDIGSYSALLPYTQERYIANHTLMSAVDKLHKIYSTDMQPIVWARSVGVEVLNELDSVKAALMMTAGARASKNTSASSTLWSLAGSAVETASSAIHGMGVVGGSLGNALGSALRQMYNRTR